MPMGLPAMGGVMPMPPLAYQPQPLAYHPQPLPYQPQPLGYQRATTPPSWMKPFQPYNNVNSNTRILTQTETITKTKTVVKE